MGIKDQVASSFGTVLRQLREARGLTQEQLGFECGLRRTFISVLELGQQQPTLTSIFKIALALGMPASDLIKKVEDTEPSLNKELFESEKP